MGKGHLPHDAAYKQFFSNPEMVASLLRDFVPAGFIAELDFSTLERCSGSYVTDDLRERHDDIVWRVGWKKGDGEAQHMAGAGCSATLRNNGRGSRISRFAGG